MKDILANISVEQAAEILERLWDRGGDFRRTIMAEVEKILCGVDVDEVAQDVLFTLDSIDAHELWDRSGPNRDGYSSPDEMAMEMVEEQLSPFLDQIENYHRLEMNIEETLYCMGVLKGLYLYEKGGNSEFREWATDIPGECFGIVLTTWRRRERNGKRKRDMDDFLREACPDWAK